LSSRSTLILLDSYCMIVFYNELCIVRSARILSSHNVPTRRRKSC
jgi:hypothetical protein